jgi:hypothetical protein
MNSRTSFSHIALAQFALIIALSFGLSTAAGAATLAVTAAMDGPQANAGAGTGSAGVGTLTGTFDNVTKQLTWSISWSGLTGTPTLMHFHGPALPNQNAGVQVTTGVVGPPVIGNAVVGAGQEADLLAGLWYLNLHTTAFGGGEIRGQVSVAAPAVPGPGLILVIPLMIAGGFTLSRRRMRA